MSEIQRPVLLVLSVTIGISLVAAVLIVFAGVAPGGAAVSSQVISSSNGYINMLPYVAAILASGFVLTAMGTRRRG